MTTTDEPKDIIKDIKADLVWLSREIAMLKKFDDQKPNLDLIDLYIVRSLEKVSKLNKLIK